MTSVESGFLIGIVSFLLTVLAALIGWIGSGMVTQLKNIASSVSRIEVDLGILNNDHIHLKKEVKEIKEDVNQTKERVAGLENDK